MNALETNTNLTFTVPISAKFKRQAERFRSQQKSAAKGDKVYYNTLAVLAVDFYCKCMGIYANLENSASWNLITQTLADVADLYLENLGFLECRPVLVDADIVEVPAEVLQDRIGYLAVKFNAELTEAKILGFLPQADREEIPLNEWGSLEDFLEKIEHLTVVAATTEGQVSTVTKLSQWLDGAFEAGWESLNKIAELLEPQPQNFAWRTRTVQTRQNTLEGAKLIELEKTGDRLALLVSLTAFDEEEIDVEIELFPIGNKTHLPEDLQLAIIDKTGEAVMQAIARSTQNIQLDFSAQYEETFQVKLSLEDTTITELFQV